jgi:hypothetical protein
MCHGKKERRRRRIITRIAIAKHPMAPNSKNDDDYQFARARSTWKPNFLKVVLFAFKIFKMATISKWLPI